MIKVIFGHFSVWTEVAHETARSSPSLKCVLHVYAIIIGQLLVFKKLEMISQAIELGSIRLGFEHMITTINQCQIDDC